MTYVNMKRQAVIEIDNFFEKAGIKAGSQKLQTRN